MLHPFEGGLVLLLVFAANAAPVLQFRLFGPSTPVDFGVTWPDATPLLGPSKTWRGLAAGVALPALLGSGIGPAPRSGFMLGLAVGGLAMLGDLLASFIKRRLRLPSGARATGLDQLPEALLPALGASLLLPLGAIDIALIALGFAAIEMLLSPWLYRLGLRKHPY